MKTATAAVPDAAVSTVASGYPYNVLFLFDQLWYLEGGAERTLLKITQRLPRDRYRPSVVTFTNPPDPKMLDNFPCPVYTFPIERTWGLAGLKTAAKLWSLIRSQNISIVHTFFSTSDLFGGLIARLAGCPIVISSRRDMGFQRTSMHRVAYRYLRPLYTQVQTVSEAVREVSIREDHLNPDKVVTVPNGVPLEDVAERYDRESARAAFKLSHASHVVVEVSTVRPFKGIDVFVSAAAKVCRAFPRAVFLVVGRTPDPMYLRSLQAKAAEAGLRDNILFLGPCDNVFPILQMADVFCHLSRTDGLSNALIEAMACGLPCVVSRVGGNPEVIEPSINGYLVDSEDAHGAAEAVISLLRNPAKAAQMGQCARQLTEEKFTAGVMVSRMVSQYDRLIGEKGAMKCAF